MAAGMGMSGMPPMLGMPAASPQLRPLDPPFPPLPPAAQIDEHMEQGRIPGGTSPTMRVALPPMAPPSGFTHDDVPSLATMHMPAPSPSSAVPVENAAWPNLDVGLPDMPVRGGGMPSQQVQPAPGGEIPAIPPANNPIARFRSGLGQRLKGRSSGPAPSDEHGDDFAPPMMPAIGAVGGVAAAPPPADFMVAGGKSLQASAPGVGGESAAFGDGSLHGQEQQAADAPWRGPSDSNSALVQEGKTGEFGTYSVGSGGGWSSGYTGESAVAGYTDERAAAGYTGEYARERYSLDDSREMEHWTPGGHVAQASQPAETMGDDRPFSATRLGLPSLTSPALRDLPPGWQDVVGAPPPAREREHERERDYGRENEHHRSEPRRPDYEPFESSGAFDGASSAAWSNSGETRWSESRENRQPEETGDWSSVQPAISTWEESAVLSAQIAIPDFTQGQRDNRRGKPNAPGKGHDEPLQHDDFDDERVWTRGMTAVKPRGRLLRRIALFAVFLLLFDMVGLVIARPDLCPNDTCRMVSGQIHQALPFLRTWTLSGTPPLSTAPAQATFAAVVGKQTTTTLIVTNTGSQPVTWQATAGLPWLSVAPNTATLKPGATLPLTITAHPVNVKPATYTSTVTLAVGPDSLDIPVTVTVQAGPQLAVSPTTLLYSACGTTKTVTIKNGGDNPLTFNAAPSQSDALTLSAKSGTVAPGASSTLRVTLTCQAAAGSAYTVNISSNGGSATVSIQFG